MTTARTYCRSHVTCVLLLIVAILYSQPGYAWGVSGHRIMARIAARHLTPVTRAKVGAILGVSDARVEHAMSEAANWPDAIDREQTKTASWHFINVPVFSPFSPAGFCPDHECIIDRIEEMQTRLSANQRGFALARQPEPPRSMTFQEVAFLIHLIGDIHQPLHAVGNADRGGNCVELSSPIVHDDGTSTTNLHGLWDIDQVTAVTTRHGGELKTTAVLVGRSKKGASIAQKTPLEWARESHDLARRAVYQKLNIPLHTAERGRCAAGIDKVAIPSGYLQSNIDIVERRLIEAGGRLANVLNRICAGRGCQVTP